MWGLIESNEYTENFSIEIDEGDANLMELSEEGHLLAMIGKN